MRLYCSVKMNSFWIFTIIALALINPPVSGKSDDPCTVKGHCLNGGTCVRIDAHSMACVCPSKFTGEFCEFHNACDSSPCKNGGSCEPFEDSGVCNCLFGYEGSFCERKMESVLLSGGSDEIDVIMEGDDDDSERERSAGLSKFLKNVKKMTWKDGVLNDPCFVQGGGVIRCMNQGKCVPLGKENTGQQGQQYECECSEKFTGPYCEFENACFSSPCKNGGSCEPNEDSGVCRCPVGFGGMLCEEIETRQHVEMTTTKKKGQPGLKPIPKKIRSKKLPTLSSNDSICSRILIQNGSNPCSQRGECVPLNETHYECICTEKYSGERCQYRNPCYDFECLNGATCEVFEASGICNCALGYTGTFCEEDMTLINMEIDQEEVNPSPANNNNKSAEMCTTTADGPQCFNGGTCTHLKGSPSSAYYECICPSDFTGRWCEFPNACNSSPCLNGGTCDPIEDSGFCTCPPGFKGTFCGEINDTTKPRVERLGKIFPVIRKEIKEGLYALSDGESNKRRKFYGAKKADLKKFDHCDNSENNDGEKPVCLNGGRCVILDEDTYGCECTIAFTGAVCQFEDVCSSAPCINGGSCESFESSGMCNCPPEWTGQFCEDELLDSKKVSKSTRLLQGSAGNELPKYDDAEDTESDTNSLDSPYSMLNHLYKSKIPPSKSNYPSYPDFLQLQPHQYYEDNENHRHAIRIPGFEDIDSKMIRIASDGTVYVRQPKRKKVSDNQISKESPIHNSPENFSESGENVAENNFTTNNNQSSHIVDASIVKVMPNGELFIKMKIPRHSKSQQDMLYHHHHHHKKTEKAESN